MKEKLKIALQQIEEELDNLASDYNHYLQWEAEAMNEGDEDSARWYNELRFKTEERIVEIQSRLSRLTLGRTI